MLYELKEVFVSVNKMTDKTLRSLLIFRYILLELLYEETGSLVSVWQTEDR